MKTFFAVPSHSYNIMLDERDIKQLVTHGRLIFKPSSLESECMDGKGKNETVDGHRLYYQGSEDIIPIQFVSIYAAKKDG